MTNINIYIQKITHKHIQSYTDTLRARDIHIYLYTNIHTCTYIYKHTDIHRHTQISHKNACTNKN